MKVMAHADLIYDPNDVGADLTVACLISQGPRHHDAGFDPRPGDRLLVTDDDNEDLEAQVAQREGDIVWLQLTLPDLADAATVL